MASSKSTTEIPPRVERQRSRLVAAMTLLIVVVALPCIVQYARLDLLTTTVVVSLGTLGGIASLAFLHFRGNSRRAGWISLLLLVALLLPSIWVSGGFYDPNFGRLYLLPIAAYLFVGKKVGVLTMATVLVLALLTWSAAYMGVGGFSQALPDPRPFESLALRLGTIVAFGVVTHGYASHHARTELRLEESNAAIGVNVVALRHARDDALASLADRQQLIADVSHELRTPLNGVVGFVEILATESLTARQHDHLEQLKNSCTALRSVLDDLLDVSKAEAGKIEFESLPFEPAELVEDVAGSFAGSAYSKGVDLLTEFSGEVTARVHGDPARLRQVLANLVGNAIKFTDDGEVSMSLDITPADHRMSRLTFEVQDTGAGLTAEEAAHVFEPFRQGAEGQRRGGTGLGLALCDRFLRLMGSELKVESSLGVGSRFYFELALEVELDSGLPSQERASDGGLDGTRLLIVDASERFVAAVTNLVGRLDITCQSAATVDHGAEQLATSDQPFDFVLIDLRLLGSDMGGALHRIRSAARERGTAILASGRLLPEAEYLRSIGFAGEVTRMLRRRPFIAALRSSRTAVVPAETQPARGARRRPKRRTSSTRVVAIGRVLVAEDNDVNQRVTKGMLHALGVACDIVDDGQQAVAALSRHDHGYRVVLMDCRMPILDGFEAAAQIREVEKERGKGERVPIVAVTANAGPADRAKALEAGMDDHVPKPLTVSSLRAALAKWNVPLEDSQS